MASTEADGDDGSLMMLCPACGYDLRATAGDRCTECGIQIDRDSLRESGLPWAHRKRIGRVRAYVRTVWRVTMDRHVAYEAARPQDPRDGRAFRRATAALVAATLLAAWTWTIATNHGLTFLAFQPSILAAGGTGTGVAAWWADLVVPWSAGATLPWVIPACLVLLAVYLTGVQQAVFRARSFPQAYRRRAGTIAHYAAAPLALVLPGLALPALAKLSLMPELARELGMWPAAVAMVAVGVLLAVVAFVGTLWRVGIWVARVRHTGPATVVLAAAELAGLWLFGLVLLLGLVPWCVGLLWVVVDSFR